MNDKSQQIFMGQCFNAAINILLHKGVDLEMTENMPKIYELGKRIYKQGLLADFLDTSLAGLSTYDAEKECPKCKKMIYKSWKKHFDCGWIENE